MEKSVETKTVKTGRIPVRVTLVPPTGAELSKDGEFLIELRSMSPQLFVEAHRVNRPFNEVAIKTDVDGAGILELEVRAGYGNPSKHFHQTFTIVVETAESGDDAVELEIPLPA